MNEIPESVTPLENMHETSVWTRPLQENGNTLERTIVSLRKELLDAKNNLATLENALEDRQMKFDALVEAAQTKTSEATENNLVKRKNRLATAILETEQAAARMKNALATLNRRIISEYTLSKELAGDTYTPPPPPPAEKQNRVTVFLYEKPIQTWWGTKKQQTVSEILKRTVIAR